VLENQRLLAAEKTKGRLKWGETGRYPDLRWVGSKMRTESNGEMEANADRQELCNWSRGLLRNPVNNLVKKRARNGGDQKEGKKEDLHIFERVTPPP